MFHVEQLLEGGVGQAMRYCSTAAFFAVKLSCSLDPGHKIFAEKYRDISISAQMELRQRIADFPVRGFNRESTAQDVC